MREFNGAARNHWTKADGTPIAYADQTLTTLDVNGITVKVLDQAGTHEPKGGPKRPGQRLIAAHFKSVNGHWSAWLIGPAKGVEKHREAFLAWIKTARLVDAPKPEEKPAEPGR